MILKIDKNTEKNFILSLIAIKKTHKMPANTIFIKLFKIIFAVFEMLPRSQVGVG